MLKNLLFSIVVISFLPLVSYACTSEDYSIVYVNGILTTKEEAKQNQERLETIFTNQFRDKEVHFISGYNPSHLAGAGDLTQSVFQAFNTSVSDYDLKTILMQIYPQVTTRKILLVGHSQGTFYTNELYKYLTTHGVPKESISVYNIATPASYVEGGGGYVTSTNDKLMNYIRTKEINANAEIYANSFYTVGSTVASALRANITIPPEEGYEQSEYAGHKLSVYLDGAAPRIMRDIDRQLGRLKAATPAMDTGDGCFVPPEADISYKAKSALFAVAEPLAKGTAAVVKPVVNGAIAVADGAHSGALAFTDYVASGLRETGHFAQSLFTKTLVADNSNTNQAAAAALATPNLTVVPLPRPSQPQVAQTTSEPQKVQSVTQEPVAPPDITPEPPPVLPVSVPAVETPQPPASPPSTNLPSFFVAPGFGGGGGASASSVQDNPSSDSAVRVAEDPVEESSAPEEVVVVLSVLTPSDDSTLATTTVTVSGTATAGAIVAVTAGAASATTSADTGAWSLNLILSEGTTTISMQASDGDGHESETLSRTVTVDTIPPEVPVLSVVECAQSLVAGMCAVPTTDVTLSWSVVADAVAYGIEKDGVVVVTTSASTSPQSISTSATTTFAVVAYDAAGNSATSDTSELIGLSRPVIINEIAWGGDDIDATRQWIELKNLSSYTLQLSNITISRSGGSAIVLSGTIARGGYAVVEASDVPYTGTNKIITPFTALATKTAEQLSLMWNTTMLDSTPAESACPSWCKGSLFGPIGSSVSAVNKLYSPRSMERTSDGSDGSSAASWQETDSYGPWAGGGGALWGTPGAANSAGLPDAGVYCGSTSNLITDDAEDIKFNPSGGCTYLARFITGSTYGAKRFVALYRGTVGNSTAVTGHFAGKALALSTSDGVPADAVAGEQFFFAIYEARNWDNVDDSAGFDAAFKTSASPAPHGNYVTIPFTYQP